MSSSLTWSKKFSTIAHWSPLAAFCPLWCKNTFQVHLFIVYMRENVKAVGWICQPKIRAPGEDRTHDLQISLWSIWIMRLTRCLLRYRGRWGGPGLKDIWFSSRHVPIDYPMDMTKKHINRNCCIEDLFIRLVFCQGMCIGWNRWVGLNTNVNT